MARLIARKVAEGKIGDSGTWRTLRLLAMASGATATSATASGHFGIDVRGLDEVRLRVSAYTAGTVTVTGRALAEGEAVGSDVVTATISGTPSVTATISGTPSVSVSGTATVSVSGTVTVDMELWHRLLPPPVAAAHSYRG